MSVADDWSCYFHLNIGERLTLGWTSLFLELPRDTQPPRIAQTEAAVSHRQPWGDPFRVIYYPSSLECSPPASALSGRLITHIQWGLPSQGASQSGSLCPQTNLWWGWADSPTSTNIPPVSPQGRPESRWHPPKRMAPHYSHIIVSVSACLHYTCSAPLLPFLCLSTQSRIDLVYPVCYTERLKEKRDLM